MTFSTGTLGILNVVNRESMANRIQQWYNIIPLSDQLWTTTENNSCLRLKKPLKTQWLPLTRPCTTVRDSEDILQQSPFQKYTTCWVFLALYFAFAHLTYGNIIFDTLERSYFQKYTTCWVFLALCDMLYLCICIFVFVRSAHGNIIFDILEQSSFQQDHQRWRYITVTLGI